MHDQIIVAVFPSRTILSKALDYLAEEMMLEIQQAAIVVKDATGEVLVLNDDIGADEGGLVGSVVGSVSGAVGIATLGALALPGLPLVAVLGTGALAGAGIGWVVGQAAASTFDFGFDNIDVDAISDRLQEGHTALMLRVEDAAALLPKLEAELKPYRAQVVARLRELQTTIQS
ncbi:MAG: hypothetical protein AAF653_00855 [Chloroflexota bacterium]